MVSRCFSDIISHSQISKAQSVIICELHKFLASAYIMPKPKTTRGDASTTDCGIVVTAQQSRFHTEAIEAPTSKDIDIKDLTIAIGGLEILDHAHLKIQDGKHYVFHGRNGTGKSTLLRALAERRIPGIASNLRILLLGQTRITSDIEGDLPGSQDAPQSVLEHVTRSDVKREKALKESQKLASVVENKDVLPRSLSKAVREVQLDHADHELREAQLTAARRSGARGAKARQVLIEKEELVERAKQRYASAEDFYDPDY
jgi:ATP-binding cassette, subfamily F, member 3